MRTVYAVRLSEYKDVVGHFNAETNKKSVLCCCHCHHVFSQKCLAYMGRDHWVQVLLDRDWQLYVADEASSYQQQVKIVPNIMTNY